MPGSIDELAASIDEVAASTMFSGVVRVDRAGETIVGAAYGAARRDLAVANTLETTFALASGAKTFTALTVLSLVDDGTLDLATTARSVLGADLPLIDDAVTVEQLLSHYSGIGDYLDENNDWSATDYVMPVPVHELATTEDYLKVLDGFPQKARPGERFEYCNGGYVVLALIAERASGTDYHELVSERVCRR
ncbi:MAG TPA: serine hydrolase domain-containing protein, partial [Ilumatobacteraceae bacterium]